MYAEEHLVDLVTEEGKGNALEEEAAAVRKVAVEKRASQAKRTSGGDDRDRPGFVELALLAEAANVVDEHSDAESDSDGDADGDGDDDDK